MSIQEVCSIVSEERAVSIIEWKDAYSVRIQSLDIQHKKLLEIVNRVSQMMEAPDPSAKECFVILNELAEYADDHFATEERLLKEHGYPRLAQHLKEHVLFTGEVFKLAQMLEKDMPALRRRVTDFVKDWYISHVLGTDREYIEFLTSKGLK
jgi:hemerythrin-like metal-binding protein